VTLIVAHRRNLPDEVAETPAEFGIEMDIRSQGDRLVVTHEPFDRGVDFEEWLDTYAHAFLVANVKEEGLEQRVEAALAARGIEEWAYLDQSFPFMVKTLRRGESRCMVRVSEYESVRTALAVQPRVQWVWLDSFTARSRRARTSLLSPVPATGSCWSAPSCRAATPSRRSTAFAARWPMPG
jgi:hypothetical protein